MYNGGHQQNADVEQQPKEVKFTLEIEEEEEHGGRFDFDDGGVYCGMWFEGRAQGHGVSTGPKGMGEYSGSWVYGFEDSGVYTWPTGNRYKGHWYQGRRHGLGVEQKGRWIYQGEWSMGFKGRYGVRESPDSGAKYEGTWTTGLQEGYGTETYADGGTFSGQWLRGMRHGYGIRQSTNYGLAAICRGDKTARLSLTSLRSENEEDHVVRERDKKLNEGRGGFVLKQSSTKQETARRRLSMFSKSGRPSIRRMISGLKIRKQKSTGDLTNPNRSGLSNRSGSVRSNVSNFSGLSSDTNTSNRSVNTVDSFVYQEETVDPSVTEHYYGEWKNDKRCGFGICERTDGLRYEGEWYNNKKHGYGATTLRDGSREEGKYKDNVLITSSKKNKIFLIGTQKLTERVAAAASAAQIAADQAQQKANTANLRAATARLKAELATEAGQLAVEDSEIARQKAQKFAPEFRQPGISGQFEVVDARKSMPSKPQKSAVASALLGAAFISVKPSQETVKSQITNTQRSRKTADIQPKHLADSIRPQHTLEQQTSVLQQQQQQQQQQGNALDQPGRRSSVEYIGMITDHMEQYSAARLANRPAGIQRIANGLGKSGKLPELQTTRTKAGVKPATGKKGSLPDVHHVGERLNPATDLMRRDEAARLASERRREIIRERELAGRRWDGDMRVWLHDIGVWLSQRQLLILVLLLNLGIPCLFMALFN